MVTVPKDLAEWYFTRNAQYYALDGMHELVSVHGLAGRIAVRRLPAEEEPLPELGEPARRSWWRTAESYENTRGFGIYSLL